MGVAARGASRRLARASGAQRDDALLRMVEALLDRQDEVLSANEKDCETARANGVTGSFLDRLFLDEGRLEGVAAGVRGVLSQPDPLAEVFDERTLPNGLQTSKRRVPLGVIGLIYESRPNITIDIAALCVKSGNAAILRGGREAFHTNTALAGLAGEAAASAGLPRESVQIVGSTDRALVGEMLRMKEYIDLMVPRGGSDLVHRVADEAEMPAVTGGSGRLPRLRGQQGRRRHGGLHRVQRQSLAPLRMQRAGHGPGALGHSARLPAQAGRRMEGRRC